MVMVGYDQRPRKLSFMAFRKTHPSWMNKSSMYKQDPTWALKLMLVHCNSTLLHQYVQLDFLCSHADYLGSKSNHKTFFIRPYINHNIKK